MQQIEICKQDGPGEHDLGLLRRWLCSDEGNGSSLEGPGWNAWDAVPGNDQNRDRDFVVLSSKHRHRDWFERWIGDSLLKTYHRFFGRHHKRVTIKDEEHGLTDYDDTKIYRAADVVCTLLAPLLTTIPMFVLSFESGIKTRLGLIMAFTTLFSIRSVHPLKSYFELFGATA